MDIKLLSEDGRALYKLRGQTVEPVFGQVKTVRNCDTFMRRGKDACDYEWKLICLAHNLLKLWRHGAQVAKEAKRHASCGRKTANPVAA